MRYSPLFIVMPSPGGEQPLRRAACVGAAATSQSIDQAGNGFIAA
jgi:hypothetical protein